MADDKRMERLLKRAKPFLDEKIKAKLRFAALKSTLELATTDLDQSKFFEAHDYSIYAVSVEYFAYKISKIKLKIMDKPSILSNKDNIYGREIMDILEIIDMLCKLLKNCKTKIKQGWQRRGILNFIEAILVQENNHRIRKDGLKLFLLFVEYQTEYLKDFSSIYSNIVNLDAFETPLLLEPRIKSQSHCIGEDEVGVVAQNMKAPTFISWSGDGDKDISTLLSNSKKQRLKECEKPEIIIPRSIGKEDEDNVELLEDILIKLDKTANQIAENIAPKGMIDYYQDYTKEHVALFISTDECQSLRLQWKLFKNEILRILFPSMSRILGFEIQDNDGFESCPSLLLEVLMNFISKTTTFPLLFSENMSPKEVGMALLHELILNDESSRELVHEIIRQAMMSQSMRVGTYIISNWIMAQEGEQHGFLCDTISDIISSSDNPDQDFGDTRTTSTHFNRMIRRYMNYLRLAALDKRLDDETQVFSV